jgi:hypothetical protein
MRELSDHEINSVSGAGIVKDRIGVKLGLGIINRLGSLIMNHGNPDKTIAGIPKDYISKGIKAINKTVDVIDAAATDIHNKIIHKIK